jgi:pyruvate dehydrogenase E2 component (dihydrolipoamide acetyltransferase)
MVYEVMMPRLGWNMDMGALSSWRKLDGDFIDVGEILFEVESDKAVQEVEALESGTLRIPADSPPPGQMVPVGTRLAYLLKPGEMLPSQIEVSKASVSIASGVTLPLTDQSPASAGTTKIHRRSGRKQPAISPRAARLASELGVDWTRLKGSGSTGRIIERDVRQSAVSRMMDISPEVNASPLARRLAEELGVNLAKLAAQIPGKRIERADVESAVHEMMQKTAGQPVTPVMPAHEAPLPAGVVLPVSPVRRMTADKVTYSAHTSAPVTLTTEADATELVRLRRQLKDDGAPMVPSYTDLLVGLAARALIEHPQLNAHFEGESIIQPEGVNMGIAVETERGLLVPVIRNAHVKSLRQITQETSVLIEKARNGNIHADELREGTFTITNLGMYEIDAFTPIINLPECAILGVGRIIPKQVVIAVEPEKVAICHMVFLSLTFDHRLVDGAPAARFLQRIKQFVEKPYLWLVG